MDRLILAVAVGPAFAAILAIVIAASIRWRWGGPNARATIEFLAPTLYAATVCAAALLAAALEGFNARQLGLIRAGASAGWVVAAVICAVPLGALSYFGELLLAHRAANRRRGGPDGDRTATSAGMRSLSRWGGQSGSVVLLGIVIAVAEETVFRGYLLTGLRTALPLLAALALQAALFGVHHASFGLRAVPAKMIHALIWGGLTVLAGTVLPAVLAHATFQILVQRRFTRLGATSSAPTPALATAANHHVRTTPGEARR